MSLGIDIGKFKIKIVELVSIDGHRNKAIRVNTCF